MVATDIIIRALNSDDESLRGEILAQINAQTMHTLRTEAQEAALHNLVAHADVHAAQGHGEGPRIDDTFAWHAADFIGKRRLAQVPLTRTEVVDYLHDAFFNSQGAAEDEDFILMESKPTEATSLPEGAALAFLTPVADEELHPLLTEMLNVLDLAFETIQLAGRRTIVASLSSLPPSVVDSH
jgi:hypothetical protein